MRPSRSSTPSSGCIHEDSPARFRRPRACTGWKIAASPLVTKLWCAPGNAGIAREAECVAVDIADHAAVIDFCKANKVDFVVVGPDAPIAAGVVDDLNAAGFKAFGPTRAAGQLESSKSFTKALCRDNNIPTAAYEHFTDAGSGKGLYPRSRARRSW